MTTQKKDLLRNLTRFGLVLAFAIKIILVSIREAYRCTWKKNKIIAFFMIHVSTLPNNNGKII